MAAAHRILNLQISSLTAPSLVDRIMF